MRIIAVALAIALPLASSVALAAPADPAAPAAPAAPGKLNTGETPLGTLLDNPASKAVLQKYIPEMIANPQIEMARSMTLKQIQGFAGDVLSDVTLAKIDGDLAQIPAAS